MRLLYYRGSHQNFGDDLNGFLWPRLVPDLFDSKSTEGFLGIGTIIGIPTPECDVVNVFTSGIGYDRFESERAKLRVWCVRGPLSAGLLGVGADATITDGAVLTPFLLPARSRQAASTGVGVMPHWESVLHHGWQEACDTAGFTLISPIGAPKDVIEQLRNMKLLITESLHGAILADTYGIPWVPIVTSGNFSVFKWLDWARSVDIVLRVMNVPPPSASAILQFGRPSTGAWGEIFCPDEAAAMAEFHRRVGDPQTASPPAVKLVLRRMVDRAIQIYPAAGRLLGLGTARTAEMLAQAARLEPQMSSASMRAELTERMVEKLTILAGSVGASVSLGPHSAIPDACVSPIASQY